MSEWPPNPVTAIPDPAGTDPLGAFPLLDPVTPLELIEASNAVTSPENRVSEYLQSRTDTLFALLNDVIANFNLVQENFLHRDGSSAQRTTTLAPATGNIKITDQPFGYDRITINDGKGVTLTFEFVPDDPSDPAYIPIVYQSDYILTTNALALAINNSALQTTASLGIPGEIRLTADVPGSLPNQAIVVAQSSNLITVSGMSGGTNDEVVILPTYMRGDLSVGDFKILNLAPGIDDQDLINLDQFNEVLFGGQDDVEQVITTAFIARSGAIAMGADLDLADHRIIGLAAATAAFHTERKSVFDVRNNSFTSGYINLVGTNAMTNDLRMQDGPTDPRYKVINLDSPSNAADIVTRGFLTAQIAGVGGNDIPVGALAPFAGPSSEISGPFLLADGREVSRAIYQNLFLVIGTRFGTPSNVNVFRLPDLRGRAPLGLDQMSTDLGPANRVTDNVADDLGGKLGRETQPLTTAQLPAHAHTYSDIYSVTGTGGAVVGASSESSDNQVGEEPKSTATAGSGLPHPNVQPSLATLWFIRY